MSFQVKVREDKYEGRLLSITHNGYQWTTIPIHSDGEVLQIIDALQQSVQRTGLNVPDHKHDFTNSRYCHICGQAEF